MIILFDFDGTLHNTKKLYGGAFRKAYEFLVKEGYAKERYYSDDEVSKYLGITAPEMWRSFMPDLPKEVVTKAGGIIGAEMIEGVLCGRAVLYDGITETLDALKNDGHRLMVLSNCKVDYMNAHRRALGLDKWFDDYFCGEAFGFIPKEDIFLHIKEKYPDNRFIMVGDRYSDILVGTKNNIPAVGCLYGFGSEEELLNASVLAKTPSEIISAVKKLG